MVAIIITVSFTYNQDFNYHLYGKDSLCPTMQSHIRLVTPILPPQMQYFQGSQMAQLRASSQQQGGQYNPRMGWGAAPPATKD